MNSRQVVLRTVTRLTPATRWYPLRRALLAAQGFDVHPTAQVTASACFLIRDVSIGAESFVGHHFQVYGGSASRLTIGERCAVGPDVRVFAGTHEMADSRCRAGAARSTEVTVEDGCWIGGGAVLVGPCRIGAGSVVAAGAIVRADVPPNSLYFGPRATDLRPLRP
ncbi:acyltransferase [Micromonospora sp. RTGN7]|uniref:acyltransferase n=1 Tax=Micromonospora sp. RTGN7 TaxID=3016526 RepID=UPI0029FED633|nr:acyltransferase [Micromonospora sp. RTGN7]